MRVSVRVVSLGLVLGLTAAAGTVTPAATAEPSGSASPSPSGSGSATASTSSSAEPSRRATSSTQRAAIVGKATVAHGPKVFSADRAPDFTFSAPSVPDLHFRCVLTRAGRVLQQDDCTPGSSTDASVTTGHMSYSGLAPGADPFTFTVQAHDPGGAVGLPSTYTWHVYTVWSPLHVGPRGGATFNNPLGKKTAQRRNLARVITTIRSMPGYREPYYDSGAPCPPTVALAPSIVRVSLYSMTDPSFASAMLHAARRCVSVQLLMNNHLGVNNDPAFRRLHAAVGWNPAKPSFARRCSYGCRGRGVLHTKMFLFDSQLPAGTPGATGIEKTVMFGSSNMTQNASRVQWNDIFTVRRATALFDSFRRYYNYMKLDNGFRRTKDPWNSIGIFRTTFWPVGAHQSDPELAALHSIRCTHVGRAGVGGRSDVYINMHAWFGDRGHAFVKRVRGLYSRGCRIHILYSFMTQRVFYLLKHRTGSRMSVRRTIFSTDGDKYADVYSHFKNIAVSGNVNGNPGSRMVWTGSNNFTPDGDHFDELMVRIKSARAFRDYRDHFRFMSRRKSSARYARFYEPFGGGRAPKPKVGAGFAADTPTILSPDVHMDDDGNAKARD